MRIICSILVMAVVTYLIRMLPMTIFRKKIQSRFLQDFLYYIPYAVLSAMTIPLCNCSNSDCSRVSMERAAVDCGGSGSLRDGIACITHRTMDIEQSSTHSERTGALACSDDFMQRAISPLQSLQR